MNQARRKRIAEATKLLEQVGEHIAKVQELFEQAKEIAEEVRDEEQEYFDNMPESLQSGERGEQAQEAVNELDSVVDALGGFEPPDVDDLTGKLEAAAG